MSTILFDIDKTLFNSSLFMGKFIENVSQRTGIEKSKIIDINKKYIEELESRTDFETLVFIEKLVNEIKVEKEIINDIFFDKEIYIASLYPEVKNVLQRLKENGLLLGIFSEGFELFQLKKLEIAGLKDFFNKDFIFIGRRKLDDKFIEKLPDGVFIVDDKKEVIEKLQSFNKFKLFWLNRKDDQKIDGVITIKSLLEITE